MKKIDLRLSESSIISNLADAACQRISRRAIRALQSMTEVLASGEDSGLTNVWEEICVQVQGEESIFADVYEDVVRQVVSEEISKLQAYEREAIWLQTSEGTDWNFEDEELRSEYPVVADEIVEYLKEHYLYNVAADWGNNRIRKCLQPSPSAPIENISFGQIGRTGRRRSK